MELQLLVHWESLSKVPGATFAQIFGIFSGHFGHLLRILTFRPNSEPIGVPTYWVSFLTGHVTGHVICM